MDSGIPIDIGRPARERERVKVSDMLAELVGKGMPETVSLGWLTGRLAECSFGAYMLTLGIMGVLPFVSIPVGILVGVLAVQVMAGWRNPMTPAFIAARPIPAERIRRPMVRAIIAVRWLERFVYPRWLFVFRAQRLIGLVIFLLALTLLLPVPFSNVVPALAVVFIALAYLERDGLLMVLSLIAAALALAVVVALIWGTIHVL